MDSAPVDSLLACEEAGFDKHRFYTQYRTIAGNFHYVKAKISNYRIYFTVFT